MDTVVLLKDNELLRQRVQELESQAKVLHEQNYRLTEQVRAHQQACEAVEGLLWEIDQKFFGGIFKLMVNDERVKQSLNRD